ncbi:GPP34 family phosphoprotein [Pseudonocardia sp. NPDC046786]|uniref:GOLPH3/VPS74 family protein n=1 Tax=Pseudonocardia sp. NPDC046786 TaxID=3155471 RepID=UPI0033E04901
MKQGALATGFFLIAYDEPGGRPGLAPDLLACGLVGAQLGDLVTAGALTVDEEDRVVATRGTGDPEPTGRAATLVLDSVAHEARAHPVRAWADVLGEPLLGAVRDELVRQGVLVAETGRSLLGRRRDRLAVSDRSAAHGPGLALRDMVRRPGTCTLHGAFTLALVSALGVERLLEPEIDRARVRDLARDAVVHLPAPLARLHSGVAAAAAAASLAVRR